MNIYYKTVSPGLILSEPEAPDFRREISSSLDHREDDSSDEEGSLPSDTSPNRSANATPIPRAPSREHPGQRTPVPESPIDVPASLFKTLSLHTLAEVDTEDV